MTTEQNNPPPKSSSLFQLILIFCVLVLFVNIAILDYWIIKQIKNPEPTPTAPPPSIQTQSSPLPLTCTDACQDIIKEATASLTRATSFPTQKPIITTKTIVTQPTTTSTIPKDFYITLGDGATAASDWSDLPDILITINRGQYSNVKAIYFEAYLSVPGSDGIAYARLYNATDGKPAPNSDITTSNPSPQLQTSQPITLEGTKAYKIQMKSSFGKDIKLSSGRIKITQQ